MITYGNQALIQKAWGRLAEICQNLHGSVVYQLYQTFWDHVFPGFLAKSC
jgi:hypothetical protein